MKVLTFLPDVCTVILNYNQTSDNVQRGIFLGEIKYGGSYSSCTSTLKTVSLYFNFAVEGPVDDLGTVLFTYMATRMATLTLCSLQ